MRVYDRKYCFGAYTYDGRKYFDKAKNETWHVNSLDDAKNDIFAMNDMHCDEKIFSLHWGREYKVEPTDSQIKLAHFLIDNGATMIVGGHSHIFGKTEQYHGRPIFYSLGNFIFDQEWGRDGCEADMDCIFDEKLQKKTIPTYRGTAVKIPFPYDHIRKISHWDIKIGKMI